MWNNFELEVFAGLMVHLVRAAMAARLSCVSVGKMTLEWWSRKIVGCRAWC